MTDAAAAQLRRLLALIPELADDEEHLVDELTEALGTDRATLLRDLCALTERFDDPAGFVHEGVQLFVERERVSLTSPHFRRPMRLTAAELRALELGLAMLEGERPPEEHRAIRGARERIRQAVAHLPDEDERHAATLGVHGSAEDLRAVRDALRRRRKLRLAYRKGSASETTSRVVRGHALVVASGAWYLVAFCEQSDGLRVFRLDRVERAELLDEGYAEPAADESIHQMVKDGRVLRVGEPATLTVRYSPAIARWIAEREGLAVATDGSLTVQHPLADAEWAVRHVLQYGADAEVLAPETVRELVGRRLAEMAG